MPIDDAYALKVPGKVVVVGIVAEGRVAPETQLLLRSGPVEVPVTVEAIEVDHQPRQAAQRGDRVGILLVVTVKDQVGVGAELVMAKS
jgi:selenocysteine-specific translation elongation factor